MKIDKKNWNTYRFDEFAENISQRVEPQNTDLSIYVGLEHLDPDSLHIKRHGSPSDVEGTKLKFYKGDVIFGKRRAYQRKAALAEYDGICSAHAMVLRAKTDIIDERLFPFFFHSTIFQTRAIDISVGGLSPTINWKDLAKQEFSLPPKEEQARLAELLWAADEVVERERKLLNEISTTIYSFINEIFSKQYHFKNLGKLCEVKSGFGFPIEYQGNISSTYPFFKVSDMNHSENQVYLSYSENYVNDDVLKKIKAKTYPPLSIVFPKIGATIYTDKKRLLFSESIVDNNIMVLIPNKDKVDNLFLYYYLLTIKLSTLINAGAIPSISAETVKNILIPCPEINKQKEISDQIGVFFKKQDMVKNRIILSQQLKSSLINQIF
ncbi:restriction endonuclease subunit S [Bacteroidales bacterium OttesenSCG-928-M06]|nr:restriction endonuclease subunit S [Bacteroidales bacterium OttesenSCG-928-M06]